jgi:hypothetical protein
VYPETTVHFIQAEFANTLKDMLKRNFREALVSLENVAVNV